MYLSDRDLHHALNLKLLIVDPPPAEIDTTSIDLHLDDVESAKVWDVARFEADQKAAGHQRPVLCVGGFDLKKFAPKYTLPLPTRPSDDTPFRYGEEVILPPGGFFLWQTKEKVGTPEIDPRLICFVNGKSTRARTGLLVHMTAPTIHAGWWGQVTLEIGNLGPFTLSLRPGDAVAQIVVAAISSPPLAKKLVAGIDVGQQGVTGAGT